MNGKMKKREWLKNICRQPGIRRLSCAVCLLGCAVCLAWIQRTWTAPSEPPAQEVFSSVQWFSETAAGTEPEQIGEYDLYAKAAVLMDADSGRVLYSKNGEESLPMASTTKIMTCIVALENGNLSDTVTASAYAASQPKVHLGMSKGNTYKLEDLLYSLMLESHNDSAVAIAEHIGAGLVDVPEPEQRTAQESALAVTAFAELMNAKARELGCGNTFFVTPNGLDAERTVTLETGETVTKRHSTTASELAAIMRYCAFLSAQKEKFLEITRTASYSFSDLPGKKSYSCTNHNSFLSMMEGALSGKTGFTNAAGYCYVGALKQDGKSFTVALLACGWPNNKTWKWSDTKKLMNYGLNNYAYHDFGEAAYEESSLQPVKVENGQTNELGETAYTQVRIVEGEIEKGGENSDSPVYQENRGGLLLRSDEKIQVSCEIEKSLQAPVQAGEIIGSIQYSVNGKVYKTDYIETTQTVLEIDFKWCFSQIWKLFSI